MKNIITAFLFLILVITCKNIYGQDSHMQDSSFGDKHNGTVIIPVDENDPNADALAPGAFYVDLQSNGKIVTAVKSGSSGYSFGFNVVSEVDRFIVYRYNTFGNLDTTFGVKGEAKIPIYESSYYAHALYGFGCQPDDKIVGYYSIDDFHYDGKTKTNLFRLKKNGLLDSSFGKNGILNESTGQWQGKAMKVLPTGEIVTACFQFFNFYGSLIKRICINRYTKDGILERSDTIKPYRSIKYNGYLDHAELAYTPDNKIVLLFQGGPYSHFENINIARIKNEGGIDSTFSNGLFVLPDTTGELDSYRELGGTIAVQPDKKILIGLFESSKLGFIVNRLNEDGTYDKSFGVNGTSTFPLSISGNVYSLAIQKDGKILALGNIGSQSVYTLIRLLKDGTPDSTFGTDGRASTYFPSKKNFASAFDMVLQPDGKIVTVGYTRIFRSYRASIVRYLPEKISNKTITKAATLSSLKSSSASISVSPNPVKDVLNIFSNTLSYKNISVVNTSGVTVLKDAFAGKQHSVNISALSSGIYYIRVTDRDGNMQSVKMIKQ